MAGSQYKEYPYTGSNPAWQGSTWQVVEIINLYTMKQEHMQKVEKMV